MKEEGNKNEEGSRKDERGGISDIKFTKGEKSVNGAEEGGDAATTQATTEGTQGGEQSDR